MENRWTKWLPRNLYIGTVIAVEQVNKTLSANMNSELSQWSTKEVERMEEVTSTTSPSCEEQKLVKFQSAKLVARNPPPKKKKKNPPICTIWTRVQSIFYLIDCLWKEVTTGTSIIYDWAKRMPSKFATIFSHAKCSHEGHPSTRNRLPNGSCVVIITENSTFIIDIHIRIFIIDVRIRIRFSKTMKEDKPYHKFSTMWTGPNSK